MSVFGEGQLIVLKQVRELSIALILSPSPTPRSPPGLHYTRPKSRYSVPRGRVLRILALYLHFVLRCACAYHPHTLVGTWIG